MQHGEPVKPMVVSVAADFKFRRRGSDKRARKPRRHVSANGQLPYAGFPLERLEAELVL